MKKLISLISIFCLGLLLSGCGNSKGIISSKKKSMTIEEAIEANLRADQKLNIYLREDGTVYFDYTAMTDVPVFLEEMTNNGSSLVQIKNINQIDDNYNGIQAVMEDGQFWYRSSWKPEGTLGFEEYDVHQSIYVDENTFYGLTIDGQVVRRKLPDPKGKNWDTKVLPQFSEAKYLFYDYDSISTVNNDGTVTFKELVSNKKLLEEYEAEDNYYVEHQFDDLAQEVSEWRDIAWLVRGRCISSHNYDDFIVGLKNDGSVICTSKCDVKNELDNWTDMVYLGFDFPYVYGLTNNGTVRIAIPEGVTYVPDAINWTGIKVLRLNSGITFDDKLLGNAQRLVYCCNPCSFPSAEKGWFYADREEKLEKLAVKGYKGINHDMYIDFLVPLELTTPGCDLKKPTTQSETRKDLTSKQPKEEKTIEKKTDIDKETFALNLTNPSLISAGGNTVAAVTTDGHVNSSFCGDNVGTSHWTNIVSVVAGSGRVVGLKSDGTIVAAGSKLSTNYRDWENIIEICTQGDKLYGLCADGTVLNTDFKDVVNIQSGYQCIFALHNDGTVEIEGSGELNQKDVQKWTDIQAICVPHWCFGLKNDGTVVCTSPEFQEKVAEWTNIVALYEGSDSNIIGKKADGTYVCTSESDALALANWPNIVTITGNDDGIFAICSNGKVMTSAEESKYGVSAWTEMATDQFSTQPKKKSKSDSDRANLTEKNSVLSENDPAARHFGVENLVVRENFSSGVLVDDPYCYFEIDSMETTESSFVLHYFLEVDSRGYSSVGRIEEIVINGINLANISSDFPVTNYYEYESEERHSYPVMTNKKRNRPARMEIPKAPFEALGIKDMTSLWMKFEAGYEGTTSATIDQKHDIALYMGDRDDTPYVFSSTAQTQLITDDEYLYLALVGGGDLIYSADEDGDVIGGSLYYIGWPKKKEAVSFTLITNDDNERSLLSATLWGNESLLPTLLPYGWSTGGKHYRIEDLTNRPVIFKEDLIGGKIEDIETNLILNIAFDSHNKNKEENSSKSKVVDTPNSFQENSISQEFFKESNTTSKQIEAPVKDSFIGKYKTNYVMKIRSEPNYEGERLGRKEEGDTFEVIESSEGPNNSVWGRLPEGGWICLKDADLVYTTKID